MKKQNESMELKILPSGWSLNDSVFMMVRAHDNDDTGDNLHRVTGSSCQRDDDGNLCCEMEGDVDATH